MKLLEHLLFRKLRRVAFISPHPDDVELCCGILIRRLIHTNVIVSYFCVTDGAPTPELLTTVGRLPDNYDRLAHKSIRRKETINALELLGVHLAYARFLDYRDLETLNHIASIIQDFSAILPDIDAVFCCPFEGGHPDHDICRFALAVAVTMSNYSGTIFEYASYNNCGYQVFERPTPIPFTIIAESEERLIQRHVAQVFVSQEGEAKRFRTDVEYFRRGQTIFTPSDYIAYTETPHYERFAFSGCYVLTKIREYLESNPEIFNT